MDVQFLPEIAQVSKALFLFLWTSTSFGTGLNFSNSHLSMVKLGVLPQEARLEQGLLIHRTSISTE